MGSAIMDCSWLDRLDIPKIPDFSDPQFHPYAYDGADEWFKTHRETYSYDDMEALLQQKKPGLTKPKTSEGFHMATPFSVNPQSKVDRPAGDGRPASAGGHYIAKPRQIHQTLVPAKPGNVQTQKSKPAAAAPTTLRTEVQPLKLAKKLPAKVPPKKEEPKSTQKPKNQPGIALLKRVPPAAIPAATLAAVKAPFARATSPKRQVVLNHGNHAKDEGDGVQKRHSVPAASAGEYFVHSLRAYPEDEVKSKVGRSWK